MATSGSVDFSLNKTQIIEKALRRIVVLASGETASAAMTNIASDTLNLMVKEWQTKGLNLWTTQDFYLFLAKTSQSYRLGSTAHATESYTKTEIKVAATSGATTIDVDSTTGMTAADNIGVVNDDGDIDWTTVSSVTDSDTVVLAAGISADAAVDNNVYFYTSKINRPMKVVSGRVRNDSGHDIPLSVIERDSYNNLPNKSSSGQVNQFYYDPRRDSYGLLYVWPTTDIVTDILHLTGQRPLEDFDDPTDDADFPVEWTDAIIWNLASRLAVEFGVGDKIYNRAKTEARQSLQDAQDFDREYPSSIYIGPDVE